MRKERYLGSVRFFKHLFLSVLVLAIIVPMVLAVMFAVHYGESRRENFRLKAANLDLMQKAGEKEEKKEAGQASATVPSYSALYPELYVKRQEVAAAAAKTVYLTFDDGPSKCTEAVLDVLKEMDCKATFFVVGSQLRSDHGQEVLRRIAAEGHTIAIHSETHDYGQIYASIEAFLDDFAAVDKRIYDITGIHPTLFRFPGGSINSYNSAIYEELIGEMTRRGYNYFDWNASAGDASVTKTSTEKIISNVTSAAQKHDEAVVLLHDSTGKENTVAALHQIIVQLKDAGYQFAPLCGEVSPVIFGYRK